MPKCNSPRPDTLNFSGSSVSSTRKATLCSNSCSKRSFKRREDVPVLTSLPANGEVLTWKVIVTVGSSTLNGGNATTFSGSHKVSEICNSSIPENAIISPACASLTSTRSKPLNPKIFKIRPLRTLPSVSIALTTVLVLTLPCLIRPMPIMPR